MRNRLWGALGVLLLAVASCQAPAGAAPRCRGSVVGVFVPNVMWVRGAPSIEFRWVPGRCPRVFERPPSVTLPVPGVRR